MLIYSSSRRASISPPTPSALGSNLRMSSRVIDRFFLQCSHDLGRVGFGVRQHRFNLPGGRAPDGIPIIAIREHYDFPHCEGGTHEVRLLPSIESRNSTFGNLS